MNKPWYIELKSEEEFNLFLNWAIDEGFLSEIHLDSHAYVIPYYCYFNPNSNTASYNNINIYESNFYEYATEISIEDFKKLYLNKPKYYENY